MSFTAFIGVFLVGIPAHAAAFHPVPTKAEHARPPTVTIWASGSTPLSMSFTKQMSFEAFEKTFKNGGELAAGDVDGDGKPELIVGAGPGRLPEVRVFTTDGKLISSFRAYPDAFKGGVRVAVGDTNNDGKAEIVTAPGPGIEPWVNVFNASGTRMMKTGVLAYPKEFQGGVHVVVADLDRDGMAEIVTSPGPGGGPHIRFWNGKLENLGRDFFAFDGSMADGVTMAAVRTRTGHELVVGVESWSEPLVRRFAVYPGVELIKEFYPYATSSHSGVRLATYDYDGDGVEEILTTSNGGIFPETRIFDVYGTLYDRKAVVDSGYRGALSFVALDTNGDGRTELASMTVTPVIAGPLDKIKFIEVDLKEQRLYAYERGRIARTFLVSTGTRKHPTRVMETTVTEKIFKKDYRWYYGLDSPENYNLPNVKWNLRINGPIHIHYAYWHNNFGHVMSHGCINTGKSDAEWIYGWANVGDPVIVHDGTLAVGATTLPKTLTKAK